MSRVSYVMMNPGGDEQLTAAVRQAIDELIGELLAAAGVAPRSGARRRDRRQPDHAPPRARHRPDAARQRSVHVGDERRGRRVRRRPRARPAVRLASTPDRASPATSAPTPRRWSSPRDRTAATAMQLVVDIGTNAEIVLGDRRSSVRRIEPDGPGVRRRPDQLRTAGDGRRGRGGAHRPRSRCDASVKVIGVDPWSDEPGFAAGGRRHRSHRAVRLGDHRPARRDVPRRAPRRRRHDRRRRTRRGPIGSWPTGGRTATCSTATTESSCRSPRTTCGRCNSPRRRCGPASTCCSSTPATRPVTDIRLAGAFGAHIDPLHAMVLGLVPDCPLDGVRSVGNAAGAGAVMALLSAAARRRDGGRRARHREDRDGHRAAVPGVVRRGDGDPPRHGIRRPPRRAGHPAASPSDGSPATAKEAHDDAISHTAAVPAAAPAARRCAPRQSPMPTPS